MRFVTFRVDLQLASHNVAITAVSTPSHTHHTTPSHMHIHHTTPSHNYIYIHTHITLLTHTHVTLLTHTSHSSHTHSPQARVDRQQFSSEGVYSPLESYSPPPSFSTTAAPQHTSPSTKRSSLKRNIPVQFSHFATLESGEVLKAATEDLLRIFQLEVPHSQLFFLNKAC